ncbi:MAG TPA: hypothetical protein VNM69_03895 [Bacillus sp. (in: firmicutes)]|uniref:hypothetical protein n=1 Tax=Bacillus litorisediminis TaxID=2922713 RepID=UPI001FAC41C1|nr:hypothetical protein [Bacillus litorisediminis]HWO75046.1 hypothetical protein [Bacillus sp. (in: firmicutes)]
MEKSRYQEMDERFSRFMFGAQRNRRDSESIDEKEEIDEMEEIFKPESNQSSSSEIPYLELMENIDRLMTSLSTFKPLVKKVTPLLEKFLVKKG